MMSNASSVYLAVDLGAGSGRVIAGVVQDGRLSLEEMNRFENKPFEKDGGLFWDFEDLWSGILEGLKLSVERFGAESIRSIGVDTWGVDFGFLDASGELMAGPRHYRDSRNSAAMKEVFSRIPEAVIFEETGIQFMEINTLYQMAAEIADPGSVLPKADQFLMIPDLMNQRLTGKAFCERTNASTTQLYNPAKKAWSKVLFAGIGLPESVAPELIDAGVSLGPVLEEIAKETGLGSQTQVVTVGSHDTASAVAAVPVAPDTRFAYLSSGTWSLLGVEIDEPIINPLAAEYNFTNEVGVCDTIRLLKNINGLWLVQECRRVWAESGQDWSYGELAEMARSAEPFRSLIDPDEERFSKRGDMPGMIQEYCREASQPIPETPAQILRLITDSLALKVRFVLSRLEELIGHEVDVLHIIGGGGQDERLNQSISDSINRPVIVGPFEATAAGNLMVQKLACGAIGSLQEGRELIRNSFETKLFEPQDSGAWDEAYASFTKLL
jgi:rhamnulokinase